MCDHNIKVDLETGCDVHLNHDRALWWALVNTVINCQVIKCKNIVSNCGNISFSRELVNTDFFYNEGQGEFKKLSFIKKCTLFLFLEKVVSIS
jgi:hypothetical protein